MKKYPPQEKLKELFEYDQAKGLIWKKGTKKGMSAGTASFSSLEARFIYKIMINGKMLSLPRVLWIYHNGSIPECLFVNKKKNESGVVLIGDLSLSDSATSGKRRNRTDITKGYLGVTKPKNKPNYRCQDIDGNWFYFFTKKDAATHYDNVFEDKFGERPNCTNRKVVNKVSNELSRHIVGATKTKEKGELIGVREKGKKYQSMFRRKSMGVFKTQEEAARAYNIAAYKHYGENAILNDIPNPLGDLF